MDTQDRLAHYRDLIESTLLDYTTIPYAYGEITIRPSFDRIHDQYLLINVGWDRERRIHGCLVHIEIMNHKIWIQRDGTEAGVATALVEAGIPKDQIVLGFRPPEIRQHTEYAVA